MSSNESDRKRRHDRLALIRNLHLTREQLVIVGDLDDVLKQAMLKTIDSAIETLKTESN